jgi:hypothetical protein
MSEGSVTSSRRPIISLEDYRARNKKKALDYYYKNHDALKSKMRERAQCKREQIQDSVKTVLGVVGDIAIALDKIQNVLKAVDKSQRISNPQNNLSPQ